MTNKIANFEFQNFSNHNVLFTIKACYYLTYILVILGLVFNFSGKTKPAEYCGYVGITTASIYTLFVFVDIYYDIKKLLKKG